MGLARVVGEQMLLGKQPHMVGNEGVSHCSYVILYGFLCLRFSEMKEEEKIQEKKKKKLQTKCIPCTTYFNVGFYYTNLY